MAKCEGCGALVVWAVTDNGKRMPVDAEPAKRVILVDESNSRDDVLATRKERDAYLNAVEKNDSLGKGWIDPPRAKVVDTYVSHFATCPQAQEHRR